MRRYYKEDPRFLDSFPHLCIKSKPLSFNFSELIKHIRMLLKYLSLNLIHMGQGGYHMEEVCFISFEQLSQNSLLQIEHES